VGFKLLRCLFVMMVVALLPLQTIDQTSDPRKCLSEVLTNDTDYTPEMDCEIIVAAAPRAPVGLSAAASSSPRG